MLRRFRILMDSNNTDGGSPSGYGAENTTTTAEAETTKASGSDDKSSANDTSKSEGTKDQKDQTTSESKQTTSEDGKVTEGSEGETKDGVKDDKPLELDLKGLEEAKVKDITEFAKTHKLTKEQAQALVDKRKGEVDANKIYQQEYADEEKKVFQKWDDELRNDPDFGKQNYDQSVHNVNKLINEQLPGLKNILTGSGKKLPAVLMKDLNTLAKRVYGETELMQGDKVTETQERNPWDFYGHK